MRFDRVGFASSLVLLFGPTVATAHPRQSDAERVIALGKSENRVMEHLDHLTNRIGPRLTGSAGFRRACEWARKEFESYGLANSRLEKWGEFPVGFDRGPSSGRMLAPEAKPLHFATNAWTAGTHGPQAGPAVLAPGNKTELDAARAKLKGAWVVVASAPRTTGGSTPAPDRQFRDELDKAYADEGILGTIRSGRNDLVLTGGSSKVAFDKLPTRASITLLAAEHKDIVDRLAAGDAVQLEFDIRNWFVEGPIALDNVIAEIPGTEKPGEFVVVGGHLDSWDGATGATDNGTGVATTLEAARLLAKSGVRPKRTIRFMLWGGEEQGLLGSHAWVKAHPDDLPKISAVLVHDGGTNYCNGNTAAPPMVKLLEGVFAPVTNLDPEMPFQVREVKGLSGGGSDHASFLQANVPGFFWSQKGRANYNHTHHTQFDTFDAAVPEYEKNSSIVIAVGALGIANLPELLSRENLNAPESGAGGRRLGVDLADDMTIEEVREGGIAAKIGLLKGDRLLKVGDRSIADTDELRTALREAPTTTKIVVLRNAKELEVPVELPPDAGPGGAVARRLGVRLGEGLTVDVVTPGGPADQAGFAAGDRIVKVGDAAVQAPAELAEALAPSGGSVKFVVQRNGKDTVLTVAVPERP